MFAEYAAENEKLAAAGHQKAEGVEEGLPIASPLPASVYKILVKPGDTIKSDEQNLVELEAMKTSVSWVLLISQHIGTALINGSKVFVHAGEGMSGKRVAGVRVIEGDSVNPGDALVYLE